jgi:hypothetical protein
MELRSTLKRVLSRELREVKRRCMYFCMRRDWRGQQRRSNSSHCLCVVIRENKIKHAKEEEKLME